MSLVGVRFYCSPLYMFTLQFTLILPPTDGLCMSSMYRLSPVATLTYKYEHIRQGISLLFFRIVPTKVSLCYLSKCSTNGTEVNQLSVVRFLDVPEMRATRLTTILIASLFVRKGPADYCLTYNSRFKA